MAKRPTQSNPPLSSITYRKRKLKVNTNFVHTSSPRLDEEEAVYEILDNYITEGDENRIDYRKNVASDAINTLVNQYHRQERQVDSQGRPALSKQKEDLSELASAIDEVVRRLRSNHQPPDLLPYLESYHEEHFGPEHPWSADIEQTTANLLKLLKTLSNVEVPEVPLFTNRGTGIRDQFLLPGLLRLFDYRIIPYSDTANISRIDEVNFIEDICKIYSIKLPNEIARLIRGIRSSMRENSL